MNRDEMILRALLLPKSRLIYQRVAMIRPVPDLHHYTTSAGLEGILTSGSIWATDARFLNDTTELSYSEQLIRETVLDIVPTVDRDYHPWLREFATVVKRVMSETPTYIASFCRHGDLLSQWRGYAAAGHCLTFRGSALELLEDCHIVQVVYDPEEQRQIVRETVAVHLQAVEIAREHSQAEIHRVSGNLGAQLSLYAACFKNQDFAEEHEWRAVSSAGRLRVRYRDVDGEQASFVSLPLAADFTRGTLLPLISVTQSPSAPTNAVAERLLVRFGYDASIAKRSRIPLRVRRGA